MTIYQALKKKHEIAQGIAVSLILALILYNKFVESNNYLVGTSIAIVLTLFIGVKFLLKCPCCGTAIGSAFTEIGSPINIFTKKAKCNFCPNCGVNFNEPV